ncbi:hypothetical protein ACIBL3_23605 [Kribbella sp. NPDC050124]|uniref:hypothetical protein n=1 Tax=Kribbella sp. NPDC050124 TaxID=3364114 RepID=UPI00379B201A
MKDSSSRSGDPPGRWRRIPHRSADPSGRRGPQRPQEAGHDISDSAANKGLGQVVRRTPAILAIVLGLALIGTVAIASIPAPDGTINGCRKTSNGDLIAIDSTATCPNGYVALNWNQTGPTGPAGMNGVSGYVVVRQDGLTGFTATTFCPTGKKAIGGWLHWNGLGVFPIEQFAIVGSYPTTDETGWVMEYALSASTVNVYAVCVNAS